MATRGKSGQHRVAILPNGKVFRKGQQKVPQKIYRLRHHGTAGAGKGENARQELTTYCSDASDGKPYGLKDQIYRQSRADPSVAGG